MVLQIVADIACSVISGLVLRILAGIDHANDIRWGIDIRWGVGTYLLTYLRRVQVSGLCRGGARHELRCNTYCSPPDTVPVNRVVQCIQCTHTGHKHPPDSFQQFGAVQFSSVQRRDREYRRNATFCPMALTRLRWCI